ncbi:MAG: hypothetical protein KGI27_11060 [Thaumarchaeota archaeon]|nr:hypothetical protein [Nitrososphaerota archaeon]
MKTLHLSLIIIVVFFLFLNLGQAHADDDMYVQNIKVQPSAVKLGDTFTVTATLVNNSTGPIWVEGGKCSATDKQAEILTVTFDYHAKIKTKSGLFCAGVGWYQKLDPGQNFTTTAPDYTATFIATESGTANGKIRFSYHIFNLTDPAQPGYDGKISQPFQFAISNQTGSKPENAYGGGGTVARIALDPLQQFKSGIKAEDVKCADGLTLVIKSEDDFPACVKPDAAQKLMARGWAKEIVTTNQTSLSALKLYLSTNSTSIQSGQAIGIDVSLNNTSPQQLTLPVQDNWPINGLGSGGCSFLPIGITILDGYYTEQNMTDKKSLSFYFQPPCGPFNASFKSFAFQSLGSRAITECESTDSYVFSCPKMIEMRYNVAYSHVLENGNFQPFNSGVYTVVGGDEWGHVAIRHFTVTNSTGG